MTIVAAPFVKLGCSDTADCDCCGAEVPMASQ